MRDRESTPPPMGERAMKSLHQLHTKLLKNPQTRADYDTLAGEFETARELMAPRTLARLTQRDIGQRMGTTQKSALPSHLLDGCTVPIAQKPSFKDALMRLDVSPRDTE
jgi:hypothetical protein